MRPLALLALALVLAGCLSPAAPPPGASAPATGATRPGVVIDTDAGPLTLVLYPDLMPETTASFLAYVREGFYDGRIWQRVVDNFVIQSESRGDDAEETLALETHPDVYFAAGALGMARSVERDSATHVFFVTEYPQPHLRDPEPGASMALGAYAGFGQLVGGWDALREIAAAPKRPPPDQERPATDVHIRSVREANVSVPEGFDDLYPLVTAPRQESPPYRVMLERQRVLRAGEPVVHLAVFVESRLDRTEETGERVTLAIDGPGGAFEAALAPDPADGNAHRAVDLAFPEPGEYALTWTRAAGGLADASVSWRVTVAPPGA